MTTGVASIGQILYTQGFGTRRECAGLIGGGHVAVDGRRVTDPAAAFPTEGLRFTVRGVDWPFHDRALLVLNKPAGYECSRKPRHHPGVESLLPAPLRNRDVQPVGRLDADTTGLLLLTDDGALIHRLTSPKHHVPKVYEVRCADPLGAREVEALTDGVVLHDDPNPVRAAACELVDDRSLRLTLLEGKYHQVKRMLGALGHRVVALHRSRFGALALPDDLAPGDWRFLDGAEAVTGTSPAP